MSHRFAGIYTPIVTPFTPAGDVDERGLAGNVDRYLGTPLTGLVVLGSNGEAAHSRSAVPVPVAGIVETTGRAASSTSRRRGCGGTGRDRAA